MPGILFRHIFVELFKVLAVTTAVLVTVIAFAAAIKPLSENLLDAGDLIRYILYATIPMMQYALPFSAAYAGTIVYHRMASENEISAMATSGIPYRRILLPAVGMGLALTAVMLVLLDSGVPTFWQALKRLAPNEAIRLLAAQVHRGEAWLPREVPVEIYADDAYLQLTDDTVTDGSAPSKRLVLDRVVAIEKDEQGNPRTEFTAQVATVDQYRVGDSVYLKVVLSNATIFKSEENQFARAVVVRPDAIVMPSFEQGPKGLTFRQLLAAREDLTVFPAVVNLRQKLTNALRTADALEFAAARFAEGKPLVLRGTGDSVGSLFEVLATDLRGREVIGQPVPGKPAAETTDAAKDAAKESANERDVERLTTIRQYDLKGDQRTLRREILAPKARIGVSMVDSELGPRLELSAPNATVIDRRIGDRGIRRAVSFAELALDGFVEPDRSRLSSAELASEATRLVGDGTRLTDSMELELKAAQDGLSVVSAELSRDIIARIVQRTSQAVTPLLMIVNAAILAVLLRSKPPLLVYVIGFLPAILDILMISGGEQMLRGRIHWLGFVVAYAGNAILFAACVIGALRLRKH
jgi:lipopolysaccharide export LptBFGC system permease protein LptF